LLEVATDVCGVQVYATGIEPVGQLADQVSLVKDILGSGIRRWDPSRIIDGHPQQLETLGAIYIFGFGKVSHVLQKLPPQFRPDTVRNRYIIPCINRISR